MKEETPDTAPPLWSLPTEEMLTMLDNSRKLLEGIADKERDFQKSNIFVKAMFLKDILALRFIVPFTRLNIQNIEEELNRREMEEEWIRIKVEAALQQQKIE